jgi:hypothetical protein
MIGVGFSDMVLKGGIYERDRLFWKSFRLRLTWCYFSTVRIEMKKNEKFGVDGSPSRFILRRGGWTDPRRALCGPIHGHRGDEEAFKKVADDLGLPLGDRKKTFNSRLAQEL